MGLWNRPLVTSAHRMSNFVSKPNWFYWQNVLNNIIEKYNGWNANVAILISFLQLNNFYFQLRFYISCFSNFLVTTFNKAVFLFKSRKRLRKATNKRYYWYFNFVQHFQNMICFWSIFFSSIKYRLIKYSNVVYVLIWGSWIIKNT